VIPDVLCPVHCTSQAHRAITFCCARIRCFGLDPPPSAYSAIWGLSRDQRRQRLWRHDVVVCRPLSSRERTALDVLLRAEFDGSQELRLQAGSVLAEGDGLIIDLVVDAHLPEARVRNRAPVEATVHDGDDVGGLILFVERGRLSALEYWWTSDQKPREFPRASAIGDPVVT
jgi:hypothetical protein